MRIAIIGAGFSGCDPDAGRRYSREDMAAPFTKPSLASQGSASARGGKAERSSLKRMTDLLAATRRRLARSGPGPQNSLRTTSARPSMHPTEPAKSIDSRSSGSASRANDELARRSGARAAVGCSVFAMSLEVPTMAPDGAPARHAAVREAAGRWSAPVRTALP